MLNIKKSLAVGIVAGAGLLSGVSSHAAITVPAGGTYGQGVAGFVGRTTFNDSYSFTLGGLSDLSGFAFSSFVNNFTVTLKQGTTSIFTDTSPNSFGYAGLSAGTYSLNFSGSGTTRLFSGYAGAFRITPAVPEPATVALALMAAGLLGGMTLRNRKNKS